jgi:hypothetical protein
MKQCLAQWWKQVAHLFIRVELRGTPSWQDYDDLHPYMEKNNWLRKIRGTARESALPHTMYHGNFENDISTIASALRKGIEANVWSQAIVLIISAETWSMDPA